MSLTAESASTAETVVTLVPMLVFCDRSRLQLGLTNCGTKLLRMTVMVTKELTAAKRAGLPLSRTDTTACKTNSQCVLTSAQRLGEVVQIASVCLLRLNIWEKWNKQPVCVHFSSTCRRSGTKEYNVLPHLQSKLNLPTILIRRRTQTIQRTR